MHSVVLIFAIYFSTFYRCSHIQIENFSFSFHLFAYFLYYQLTSITYQKYAIQLQIEYNKCYESLMEFCIFSPFVRLKSRLI